MKIYVAHAMSENSDSYLYAFNYKPSREEVLYVFRKDVYDEEYPDDLMRLDLREVEVLNKGKK